MMGAFMVSRHHEPVVAESGLGSRVPWALVGDAEETAVSRLPAEVGASDAEAWSTIKVR